VPLTSLEGPRVATQKFPAAQFGSIAFLRDDRVDMFCLLTTKQRDDTNVRCANRSSARIALISSAIACASYGFTPVAGVRLWSMGTALWATCASTCLT
jgi:hypothetical protein